MTKNVLIFGIECAVLGMCTVALMLILMVF